MTNAGSDSTLVNRVTLAVTASGSSAAGTPHVFVERNLSGGGGALTLASRGANAQWQQLTIATSRTPTKCSSSPPPTGPGQTCLTEYLGYELMGILPGADLAHLRLLYGRQRDQNKWVASCSGSGAGCTWTVEPTRLTGAILMAAVNGSQVEQTTVIDGLIPAGLSAAVDAQGRIHLLVSGASNFTQQRGSVLYYLRLGATP